MLLMPTLSTMSASCSRIPLQVVSYSFQYATWCHYYKMYKKWLLMYITSGFEISDFFSIQLSGNAKSFTTYHKTEQITLDFLTVLSDIVWFFIILSQIHIILTPQIVHFESVLNSLRPQCKKNCLKSLPKAFYFCIK